MAKKKKKKVVMIDMTSRLNIKIVESTEEEHLLLQRDLDEMEINIQKRMQRYEEEIRELILSVENSKIIPIDKRDSEYFISTYEKVFANRNADHIKNRIKNSPWLILDKQTLK